MRRSCRVIRLRRKRDHVCRKAASREKPISTMYFTYVLYSKQAERLYIGSSADPDHRLKAHNAGRGGWTKNFRPWVRVLLEEHETRDKAVRRERYLKSGWGRRWLKKHFDSEGWQSG